MNKTVKELRQSGYKVKVIHHRIKGFPMMYKDDEQVFFGELNPKGGRTELLLMSPEGIQIKAEAKCSNRDNYCRKVGVAIALGRAIKELEWQRKIEAMKPKKKDSLGNFINERFDEIWKEKDEIFQNELYNVAQEEVRDMIRVRNLEILKEMDERRNLQ